MAKLYKMTLYVCDLEGDLTLDEIKVLIQDRALNGIAVNCISRFSNEEIGATVEWDDDIDINYCDAPDEVWEKYFENKERAK